MTENLSVEQPKAVENVYVEVKNLRWGNKERTTVLADVLLPRLARNYGFVPMELNQDYDTSEGRDIWKRVKAGEFGKVGPCAEVTQSTATPEVVDPLKKLKSFLASNPDVAAIINGTNTPR
ncbi:hypothetical protein KQH49_06690 [Mycetohabitans sp. B5]|uniref:Uncharacterized protein n=1 Tax=Mycetohabitans endofungorum TaxID=417203 RepID=A0A2P5KA80_9BURK|nr:MULTISPECIES: hypothetical protein [Mycetohabitans]MCG1054656.1 hypothetical protein [Mycetohabitans sp. B5]PPB83599.1 hypothetical protein B0O95_107115 [Mycetohabitans endofungorum]